MSLASHSPWGHKESDKTEQLNEQMIPPVDFLEPQGSYHIPY